MVCWFAGLFYLPRLFVYHSTAKDKISIERFKVMERRLYYGITWPSAILTVFTGLWLLIVYKPYAIYIHWVQVKLSLVVLLLIYHGFCGVYLRQFEYDRNQHSSFFYRCFNEFPTVLLIAIVTLAIVKPGV